MHNKISRIVLNLLTIGTVLLLLEFRNVPKGKRHRVRVKPSLFLDQISIMDILALPIYNNAFTYSTCRLRLL